MIKVSVLSQEIVRIPYGGVDTSGDVTDPTGTTPYFAVVATGTSPSAWSAGTWETSSTNETIGLGFQQIQSPYKARYTIDGTSLSTGDYDLWFKLANWVVKVDKVEIT